MGDTTIRARAAQPRENPTAERLVFFTDAVVAIAMTLLILPLMESVSEAKAEDLTTAEYLNEHGGQLFSLALSFVLIAVFWRQHHGLFDRVERETGALVWLNIAWMFTIVWLPVATALTGSLHTDTLQQVLYIGTMLANAVIMVLMNVVVIRTPRLLKAGQERPIGGLSAAIALSLLFGVALLVAILWQDDKYYPMFLLFLTGPLARVIRSQLARRVPA
ncbi:TMEM175 family protein [Knoellia koreensis]|uniref:DUF1211 domain-containing protein n=1 Tax=Knoellia koreensis TaxID=2730921 RepID=A0A849HIX4_9MICO|nr:TMEM175 family protein [Knoellia sp. DB2414S]NNM47378.1 DUF1211 domain-containing protein [Knoellia sp. DB2414S]